MARRHDAEERVGHAREFVIVGQVIGSNQANARLVHAPFQELFGEDAGLVTGENGEQRIGTEIARPLQERREIRIGERDPNGCEDLRAALGDAVLECPFRLEAGRPVVDDGDEFQGDSGSSSRR
jgi:hypothetical protein